MKHELSIKTLLFSYIREQIKGILLFLVCMTILAVVFFLHRLSVDAVIYGALLCIVFLFLFFIVNFYFYQKKYRLLLKISDNILYSLEEFPRTKSLMEQNYQEIITVLNQAKAAIISETDYSKSEMIDYYTLWVHQIKTPIAAMRLLLCSKENEQDASSILPQLSTELFKIEQYVEMVLSYLRLGSSSNDFIIRNYSLDDIIKQALRKYAPLFIQKKIKLNFKETGFTVLTDEKWLLFVIEQLLSNALKYTRSGIISIHPANGVTLVIADTGIGIAREDIYRIFEKGFTGYNGREDKKSTGIGLYLCKKILTKLSHSIWIESEINRGTKVYLKLESIELNVF